MTQAIRPGSRMPSGFRLHGALRRALTWLLLLMPLAWAQLSLTGCAGGVGAATATAEPVTDFDEPDARKRARLRLELASAYGPAFVLRGLVYMRLNDNRLAEESFQRALQINPRDPDALHNYGWFSCQLGRNAQAVELFTRALASPVYAGQAKTYMAKGICQTRMGQFPEAEGSFARSYELDAGNPITGYNLASLLFRRGDDSRAQFYIRRLNNSDLANAETLWLGIKVERRLGNTEAMQQLAQQLSRRYPQSREWTFYQRGAFDE